MPEMPSLDPEATRLRDAAVDPSTLDQTGVYEPAPETLPRLPDTPADAPAIPGYAIASLIAKGGMGLVWLGRDLILDRDVAIKTFLPGGDAGRFVIESKITARLPHPGIPPVHALGMLSEGTHYLVMKFVKGRTLAAMLDKRSSPAEDLPRYVQVFEQIAQAVGFAHSQGVIHRDLKPLNVMVGAFGEVQVMDWGLARNLAPIPPGGRGAGGEGAYQSTPTNNNNHTIAGAIMGTPGYMAPEQARGEAVDARADVFSLGALLAAILTGKPAFVGTTMKETIQKAAQADLADVLNRLKSCDADVELWKIAKRCLKADADKRLPDGQKVADAVAAYRSSVEERLREASEEAAATHAREQEQRKRRRAMRWATGIVVAVLLAGIAGTTIGLVLAMKQSGEKELARQAEAARAEGERLAKEDAEDKKTKSGKATEAARLAKEEAEKNLAFSKKGNEILGSVFTGLDPKANYATVADLQNVLKANLSNAVKELEGSTIGDPLVVAEMQKTLGESLIGLGETQLAITVFEKARDTLDAKLGFDHPRTLTCMSNLGWAYRRAGELDLALPLLEKTLKLQKAKLGPEHPETLASMGRLAFAYREAGKWDSALPLFEETLKLQKAKLGPEHLDTLTSMGNLAWSYRVAGKWDLALPLLEETLKLQKAKLGPEHPGTLISMGRLAAGYHYAGRLDLALPLFEETFKLQKAKLGPDHLDTLTSMGNLAMGYKSAERLDLALPLYEETLKLRKAKYGTDHPDTLNSMVSLAGGYQGARRLDLALPLYEETFKLRKAKLGSEHPDTLTSMGNLAWGYQNAGKLDLALPLFEETFKLEKAKLGPDHPFTIGTMAGLAACYQASGKLDLALPLLEETLKLAKAKLGPDHSFTLAGIQDLADSYRVAGKLDLALPLYEETLKLQKAKLGSEHPDTFTSMYSLAWGYQNAGKLDLALPLFEETLKLREAKLGPEHPDTIGSMAGLAACYQASGKLDLALPLLEETLKLAKAKLGPDHSVTLAGMKYLTDGYRVAGKLDLALPLYEETLKLQKAKLGPDHPDTLTSMGNLAWGYHVTGNLDLALPLYEETLKLRKAKLGPEHPDTLTIMKYLGNAYCIANLGEKAATTFSAFVAGKRKGIPKENPEFAGMLTQVSSELLKCYQFATAEEMLRESLDIREKKEPDVWTTFYTQSVLGEALRGQKNYAEAEPMLVKGYEGMKAREKTMPAGTTTYIPEALDRMIALYTVTDKPIEAKQWQAERAKYPTQKEVAPLPREVR